MRRGEEEMRRGEEGRMEGRMEGGMEGRMEGEKHMEWILALASKARQ
jgi:hypothetical protein